jgi:NAD(P)-dependent dehydrogenase (short-subunit alcohol dehydrogenase family)
MSSELFSVKNQVAVMSGGTGVLGKEIAKYLASQGLTLAILGRSDKADAVAEEINKAGGKAAAFKADVQDKAGLLKARDAINAKFGNIDILLNFAGGNNPEATTTPKGATPERKFFDMPEKALESVVSLNLTGTILPCQVFGESMAKSGKGVMLNVSSMASIRPLTRVLGYGAAKAAVNNFTQWLAVHMAQEYSPDIRVNAIAPGFFLTEQNRFLLTDKNTGEPTPRGKSIITHTPQNRYGEPADLFGATLWLISPASRFVTGIVVPVDGGFSAFSGV